MATYKVNNLDKVKKDRYIEGDFFFTNKTVGMLIDGKIKRLISPTPNLKDYVKKADVEKMIDDKLKGGSNNEQV